MQPECLPRSAPPLMTDCGGRWSTLTLSSAKRGSERRKAEQPAGAWAVQVVSNLGRVDDGTSQLSVAIRNLGNYSITQVEAQFIPDGKNSSPRSVRIEEAEFTAQGVATWVPCEYPIWPGADIIAF